MSKQSLFDNQLKAIMSYKPLKMASLWHLFEDVWELGGKGNRSSIMLLCCILVLLARLSLLPFHSWPFTHPSPFINVTMWGALVKWFKYYRVLLLFWSQIYLNILRVSQWSMCMNSSENRLFPANFTLQFFASTLFGITSLFSHLVCFLSLIPCLLLNLYEL